MELKNDLTLLRKEWFNNESPFKFSLDNNEPEHKNKRGRKPKQSKRIVNKSPDNQKWWRI